MALLHRTATASARWPYGGQRGPAMRALPWLTWVPVASVGALLLVAVLAPGLASSLALPLAVIGAAIGIPHGAADHLVPWWWDTAGRKGSSARPTATRMVGFAGSYAVIAAAALTAFVLAPTVALVVFLILSGLHFGRGEVVTSAERSGRRAPTMWSEWPVTLAHGGVVVGLLLWARPPDIDPLLRGLSPRLAEATAAGRVPGLLLVATAVLVALVVLLHGDRHLEAAELALLAAVFTVAPPLAAFGIYFGLWHSLRHTGRLLDLARGHNRARQVDDGWRAAGRTVARAAAAPSVVALLAVLYLWWASDLAGLQAEVGVLLALTLPHAAVVWALDRRVSG